MPALTYCCSTVWNWFTHQTSRRGTNNCQDVWHQSYGLSNAELGAEWPKCTDGAAAIAELAAANCGIDELLGQLTDSTTPADERLPHRDRDISFERRIAPCFIVGDDYGTRASSALIMDQGHIYFSEQTYHSAGQVGDRVDFEFPQHGNQQQERA